MAGLLDIPVNPAPRGATVVGIDAADGVELRVARWAPNRSPVRGTVVIVHGRSEFIEKYFETVSDLRRRGFAVAVFDARGQGGSARLLRNPRKGHVRDFADYVNDFETVLHEVVLPDCPPPYYVLAHSMGGLVALLAAGRISTQIDRMVLTAPLIALPRGSTRGLARISGALTYLGLGEASLPARLGKPAMALPFDGNPLTSDPERYQRMLAIADAAPGLALGAPTIGWVNAAMRACLRVAEPDFGDAMPVPSLIVLAGADTVVSNAAAEGFSRRAKTVAHLRISGARHEILMERDTLRDQFWTAFDAFIEGRR